MVLLFAVILIALSFSFMCSLSEACLLSLSLSDIAKISENKPRIGRTWQRLKENIQKPISVILIINTFANAMGAAISGSLFSDIYGTKWLALYSFIFSLIIIQWGEIIPKTLGVKFKGFVSQAIGLPLQFMVTILSPVVYLITFINRPFLGGKTHKQSTNDALNEISILTRFASLNRLISKEQEKLVARSMTLSSATVRDIMVGKDEIKHLSVSMNLTEALIEAHLHHHTRYPLVENGNLDNVLGYVNFKDIVTALRINPADPTLRGIMRPMLSVRASDNLSTMLARLTQGHHHVAVVKDDQGKTVGLVTLEDVIESVVGEIEDEYDILPNYVYQITHERFLAGGSAIMGLLRDKIDPSIPNENTTVDEWMRRRLERQPKMEDTISLDRVELVVKKVRRSKVYEACVVKKAFIMDMPAPG